MIEVSSSRVIIVDQVPNSKRLIAKVPSLKIIAIKVPSLRKMIIDQVPS